MDALRFCLISICALFCLTLVAGQATDAPVSSTTQRLLSRHRERFYVIYEWKTINYTWENEQDYNNAISKGDYIPANVVPSGIKYYDDKLFVSLPRLKSGVPATLAWIPATVTQNNTEPLFAPYPSWEMNKIGDCNSFQSVQSVEIDLNGTMWVLDNGRSATIDPRSAPPKVCQPSISRLNMTTKGSLIERYVFPEDVANASSYLNELVVDDSNGVYIYITDNSKSYPGIIVYSVAEGRSWKFQDFNSMLASKNAVQFHVGNVMHNMTVNINGITLGPRYVNEKKHVERNVYFSPMTSFKLYGMPSMVLKNESYSRQSADVRMRLVVHIGVKTSQTDGMIMDEEGFMFYGLLGNHSIAHWDHKTHFNDHQEIISKDPNYIQWVDGFGFDNTGNLFVVINKLQNFIYGKVNPDEYNYRILKSRVGTRSYLYGPKKEMFAAYNSGTTPTLASSVLISLFAALLLR